MKYNLDFDFDEEINFDLVGISSAMPLYHIAWLLNKHLDTALFLSDKYQLFYHKATKKDIPFPFYYFFKEEDHVDIRLIPNKINSYTLVPELKNIDYFLRIEGIYNGLSPQEISKKIQKFKHIQTALYINPEQLKSKHNFIIMESDYSTLPN